MQYIIILDTTHKKLCMVGVHLDPPQVGESAEPKTIPDITPAHLISIADAVDRKEWDYVDMLCEDAIGGMYG